MSTFGVPYIKSHALGGYASWVAPDNVRSRPVLLRLRRSIIEAAARAREGHIASAFSILEILYTEYAIIQPTQESLNHPRDIFILSKGHAALGLYCVLAEVGVIPPEWLNSFTEFNAPLGGHPDAGKVPGVELSTGSLGHGLAVGVGLALGNRVTLGLEARPRVVVLIGDGESNEGANWEAAALASHHSLREVLCIVDHNHSTDRALRMDSISDKFRAFGWDTDIVDDGHDVELLSSAMIQTTGSSPKALIVKTIKGKGIAAMENNPAWHHAFPSLEQLPQLLDELKA